MTARPKCCAGVKAGEELVAPVVEGLEDGGKVKLKETNS